MLKHILLSASSVLLVALAACSSSNGPETTGDEQAVSEGHVCGGIAGIRCAKGLTCVMASKILDASGTCKKQLAGKGESCGGAAAIQCESGLVCAAPKTSGPPPGTMGIAVLPTGTCEEESSSGGAKEGQDCGGLAGVKCEAGLVCETPGACCDLPGKCVKK
jgi:hypothetical protein